MPDYCPDIARIIETQGAVFLHGREIRDGRAEISGTVRVSVLYTPDGEGGIRTLEFAIPFTAQGDAHALPECAALTAETGAELLETRLLNPRKVFTHCKLVTRVTGYRRISVAVTEDVQAEESQRVEKRQEHQSAMVLTHLLPGAQSLPRAGGGRGDPVQQSDAHGDGDQDRGQQAHL